MAAPVSEVSSTITCKIILRPTRLSDTSQIAIHKKNAYWNSPLNQFLCPRREEDPEQVVRMHKQSTIRHFLSPNSFVLSAVLAENPIVCVGSLQCSRVGDSTASKQYIKSKGLLTRSLHWILSWFFWAWFKIENLVWKDRVTDFGNLKQLDNSIELDGQTYWKSHEERRDRWHVNSLVIDPAWQGKGIGRLLMDVILQRAQKEGVPIGLSASPHGELLYRKLGFECLGDFHMRVERSQGGGIFIWYPEGWQESRKAK
jgi:GNAT superfamily N-acetyltransferase